MSWRNRCLTAACTLLFALSAFDSVRAQEDDQDDPPGRVARLSVVSGDVSFQPGGEDEWVHAALNRPLIRGDRLWSDRNARAELQIGSASLRLDETTSLEVLNLDDRMAQFEVTEGVLNLRVRRLDRDQAYEIDTPTLAFTVTEPGNYRVEVDARGRSTAVIVWNGGGEATGEGSNFPLREGDAVRFYDTALKDYEFVDQPRYDEFDRFAQERDERMERAVSLQYLSEDVIGYDDLDDNGSWSTVASYGPVWFPRRVAADWAPYRYGHWIWQDPWGWTWIDDASWGFAPFHYGRWVYASNRWGWVPSQRRERAVYAPALVTFVGGNGWNVGISGGGVSIGWFPLGPREVYIPPYHASRNYFTRVNVSNTVIANTYVTNIYNTNYAANRPLTNVNWVNRGARGGMTAVASTTFVSAKPVQQGFVRVAPDAINRAPITQVANVAPIARSVMGAAGPATTKPPREVMDRRVVARTAPPPRPVPFAAREQEMQRNPGRPLPPQTVQSLQRDRGGGAQGRPQAQQNVQVVTNRATNTRSEGQQRRGAQPENRGRGNEAQTGRGREGEPQQQGQPPRQTGRETEPQRQVDERPRDMQDRHREQQDRETRGQQEQQQRQTEQQRQQQERDARGKEEQQRQADQQRQQQERARGQQEQQQRQAEQQRQQQERDARGKQEQEQQQRQAEQQRQQQERDARGKQEQEQQQRQAEQQRQQQERDARGKQEQEQQQRQAEQQRQQQERDARGKQEQQQRQAEQQQRQQQQQEQQQRQAEQQRQQQERDARSKQEQQQRQAEQQQRQAEQQQRQQQQEQQQRQAELQRQQQERDARSKQEQQQRQAEQQQRQAEQQQRQQQQQQQPQQQPQQQRQPPPQQQQPQEKKKKNKDDKDKDDDNG